MSPWINIGELDVSEVTSMAWLFHEVAPDLKPEDLSKWDVSNVTNMWSMFDGSDFNGDISGWDVSNVNDMNSMFENSAFEGDISNWDVSNVEDMNGMFDGCPLQEKPPHWYKEDTPIILGVGRRIYEKI